MAERARDELLHELDTLLQTAGKLRFQRENYDEGMAEIYGIALLDFMTAYGMEVRVRLARLMILEAAASPTKQQPQRARPLDEWHEDFGPGMWFAWTDGGWLGEPAWIGTPIDSDWPGYHTHFLPHPSFPAELEDAVDG